jgi:hypothetical protein
MLKSLKKLSIGAMLFVSFSISAVVTLTARTNSAETRSVARSHVRCPNGGRINGKFYCNVTKFSQGGTQPSSAKPK